MELRAFSICRTCFEVHPANVACPYCTADGMAVTPQRKAKSDQSTRTQPGRQLTADR